MALADQAISTHGSPGQAWQLAISQILISTSWPRALRKCMSLSAEKPLKISKQHSAVSIQPRQKPASRDRCVCHWKVRSGTDLRWGPPGPAISQLRI